MTTEISIPEDLFEAAEQYADAQGLSLDELASLALRQFLKEKTSSSITAQLNAVYSDESATLDPVLARLQTKALPQDEW